MVPLRDGIAYAPPNAMNHGHCGLPRSDLIGPAGTLLAVPAHLIEDALALELAEGTITAGRVGETDCVFLTGLHRAEHGIAEDLARLAAGFLPCAEIDTDAELPWIRRTTSLMLASS